ncbi:unnamed protein product [Bursaphelenchus okinawaensis]|uniref:Uncharacterized protein n=1 Tax=Bursaphelenchus okinawaensis TaxID=465554 RepID=A0A811LDR3_9BILA|nr:unnamed protein product [Bursaphelenchus okinawaensis]CAG9121338.1 unnamed protein product [Bursaphelenchus okinawaensis]
MRRHSWIFLFGFICLVGAEPEPLVNFNDWHCGASSIDKYLSHQTVYEDCPNLMPDVNDCCRVHDNCYVIHASQQECDAAFCECLSNHMKNVCPQVADMFCAVVQIFGKAAHQSAYKGNITVVEASPALVDSKNGNQGYSDVVKVPSEADPDVRVDQNSKAIEIDPSLVVVDAVPEDSDNNVVLEDSSNNGQDSKRTNSFLDEVSADESGLNVVGNEVKVEVMDNMERNKLIDLMFFVNEYEMCFVRDEQALEYCKVNANEFIRVEIADGLKSTCNCLLNILKLDQLRSNRRCRSKFEEFCPVDQINVNEPDANFWDTTMRLGFTLPEKILIVSFFTLCVLCCVLIPLHFQKSNRKGESVIHSPFSTFNHESIFHPKHQRVPDSQAYLVDSDEEEFASNSSNSSTNLPMLPMKVELAEDALNSDDVRSTGSSDC